MSPRSPRLRSSIIFLLKVAVAATLIGWLIRSGAIDFAALGLFFEQPSLLVGDLAVFFFIVLFGALRWIVLLRIAGVRMPFARALQLQSTSLFFNVVIPGNVGGDVLKAVYAAREATPERKGAVYLVGFVERLLGLSALVLVAALVMLARGPSLWHDPQLHGLVLTVGGLAVAVILAPAIGLLAVRRAGAWLDTLTTRNGALWRIANQLVMALRLVSGDPKRLAISLFLSMAVHVASLGLFTTLTRAVLGVPVPLATVASVFPVGILTLILPISPGGVGVGHVAFDRLFIIAGLTSGATVFNLYLVGQVAPQLLGVFPYLALRRERSLPEPVK